MKSSRPKPFIFLLLLFLLLAAMLGCSMLGVVHFGWADMWQSPIFWNLRMPRIVLSALVGAALSVCGAAYQSVFRNPLTDPYVLGISSGASLGAAIAILLGLEAYLLGVGACALVSGLLTILVIYRIASIGNRMHTTTLLLTGVCITFLMSALISFLMVLRQDKMDSIIFWTMGSFASASWTDVAIVAPVVAVGIGVVLYHCRDLNLLLAGSETAKSLGVEVERVKKVLLLATTLMVAFCVSTCGVIGFVGLVVPHCIRLVSGPDNRRIVPYAIVVGALFLLLCDTMARTLLMPAELPVGSLTALVGAPLFIYLLYKNKKNY
ncbi:MAG: iron ABC transporter permease [Bacteroidales bacterium]|jgi:iron complex transport system permease protein|nr:iron ABC transporter permease [Bacteroidales bacterium]